VIVLDASALLAYLYEEQGSDEVVQVIEQCCMSAVNLAEVISRFVRDGHNPVEVLDRLNASSIEFVPFLNEDAALAASFVPYTRQYGLSLADRACLALGAARNVPVMTADRVWAELDLKLSIKVIR